MDEQRTREQERGFGVRGEREMEFATYSLFFYIYITFVEERKKKKTKTQKMKEGMKHALGMLLHNWNCVPWTIYIYIYVVVVVVTVHTCMSNPNSPLGKENGSFAIVGNHLFP